VLPVLVIGGGVFGASFAFELTARGHQVVLAERGELAAGTSANSMKTIHGGIRHLARLDVPQVVDSIKARAHVAALFPDLVRPLRFVAPATTYLENRLTHRAAAVAYNILCHIFDSAEVLSDASASVLRTQDCPGYFQHLSIPITGSALSWMDLQVVESEQLVLRLVKAAERAGAAVRDHAEIAHIEPRGTCYRVSIQCTDTNHSYVEDFADVFDCSGEARVAERSLDRVDPDVEFVTACNLVLTGALCEVATGVPVAGSKDLLFTVPWKTSTIVGTWYFDDTLKRHTCEELLTKCLDEACSFLSQPPKLQDVMGFHLGRLPAARAPKSAPSQGRLLRRCKMLRLHDNSPASRVFVVRGTKYTNAPRFAKRMAESLYGPTR